MNSLLEKYKTHDNWEVNRALCLFIGIEYEEGSLSWCSDIKNKSKSERLGEIKSLLIDNIYPLHFKMRTRVNVKSENYCHSLT